MEDRINHVGVVFDQKVVANRDNPQLTALVPLLDAWKTIEDFTHGLVGQGFLRPKFAVELCVDGFKLCEQYPIAILRDGDVVSVCTHKGGSLEIFDHGDMLDIIVPESVDVLLGSDVVSAEYPKEKLHVRIPVCREWQTISEFARYLHTAGFVRRGLAVELSIDGFKLDEQSPLSFLRESDIVSVREDAFDDQPDGPSENSSAPCPKLGHIFQQPRSDVCCGEYSDGTKRQKKRRKQDMDSIRTEDAFCGGPSRLGKQRRECATVTEGRVEITATGMHRADNEATGDSS